VSRVAKQVAEIPPGDKRALLAKLLQEKAQRPKASPLSFGQERLWFLDRLAPGNPAYNLFTSVVLSGPLNVEALELALNEILRRHDVLRASFPDVDGKPVQITAPALTIKPWLIDISHLPEDEREREAQRLAFEEAHLPFDLAKGPVVRAGVLRLAENEHAALVTMHHIVTDGWSLSIFLREMRELYEAYCAGQPSPLPQLSIQFADFARWQRQWMQGETFQDHLAYWKQQLGGIPPLLEFPTDRPRPPVQSFHGATQSVMLSTELCESLLALSRREGVTLFMTLIAAFQKLLYRYTGKNDLSIGIPIAGRHRLETEDLIGFFINTLVLRTKLSGEMTFRELLGQARETILAAHEHQDFPFERLIDELHVKRSLSHEPLVQVAFVYVVTLRDGSEIPGLAVRTLRTKNETAKYDLTLYVKDYGRRLVIDLQYKTDLFDEATILRTLKHYEAILNDVVADAGSCLGSMSWLPAEERQELLVEWNATEVPYSDQTCVHELFEKQVERTPQSIAVAFGDRLLTYRELNEQSNQLAHHLRRLGVGLEQRVGVCVERSPEMIIAVLGVLKTGGAYLPLDPSYPRERLAYMVKDAQLSVLLTQESLKGLISEESVCVVCLDGNGWRDIEPTEDPEGQATAENLAYMIYTSGSTGTPKGVLVPHRGLCNLAQSQIKSFDVQAKDRVLQFSSFSFDASVSEIFMALLSGASLYLDTKDALMPGQPLAQLLKEQMIATVTLPPSVLSVLPEIELPALRTLISAGEACSADTIAQWSNGRRFLNAYGPTETTVCATISGPLEAGRQPLIGRPIDNAQVYVLDPRLEIVPVGAAGELYVGGAGIARGYHRRADLTATRFVPNPFGHQRGARLYKTGDLARFRADGQLEYLGRVDRQVKVRGYRVEPGEIDATLATHPSVLESVTIVGEDPSGDKQLVSYLVLKSDSVTAQRPAEGGVEVSSAPELWPSVSEFFVYDEALYYAMTNDEQRNKSYQIAVEQSVRDKVVIDIGTGKDLILARLCIEAGARKVYAIELLDTTYQLAKDCLERLGLQNKIILIHGDATKVQLPEKADVCISELVGAIGGSEGVVPIINDAWRFLKEDGVMIPQRSLTKIAAVTVPDELHDAPSFGAMQQYYVDKVFEQIGYKFDLRLCIKDFPPANLISNTDVFEDLDFTGPINPEYERAVSFEINRRARLDGFLVWLTLHTTPGVEIDILNHRHCWVPVYFPIFHPGIEVEEGDRIEAVCSGRPCSNNLNPDYRISGRLIRKSGESIDFEHESFHHEQGFKKSPYYERLFSREATSLKRQPRVDLSLQNLKEHLRKTLPEYMVPAVFVTLDEMPLTPNGKLNYAALPSPEERRLGSARGFIGPRTAIETELAHIWEDLLGLKPIGIRDSFFDLGGHSLLAVRLTTRIEKQFGYELPVATLFAGDTIEYLANVLEKKSPGQRRALVVPIQTKGPRPPFYCVHSIGGTVNNFYRLSRCLGSDYPFYGFQAARLHEEIETASIEQTASRYIGELRQVRPAGPYLLGGYSFGGFVAFEMARQLCAQGESVPLVALLDTYSPSFATKLPRPSDSADLLVQLAWVTARQNGRFLRLSAEELRRLELDEQLTFFLEQMSKAGLASQEIDHESLYRFLKGYELRQKAAWNYRPQPYAGRVTLFRCAEQDQMMLQRVEAAGLDAQDESYGWRENSSEPVEVHVIPGHHDRMCNEPYVQVLAELLRGCIDDIDQRSH
jgi:amino acid adenylation domain-containing protein